LRYIPSKSTSTSGNLPSTSSGHPEFIEGCVAANLRNRQSAIRNPQSTIEEPPMNRRQWLTILASALAVLRWPRHAHAQGISYVAAVQSAFGEFAATTASKGRIAPVSEPGVPLVVRGTLFRADGRTPLSGALVFAYHTDRHGLYNPNQSTHTWRLRGAVRTAADGSFEFRTIRPASYPQTRIPQHIHVELQTADGSYHAGEWRFADDPLIDEAERAEAARAAEFGWVRPVSVAEAAHTIDVKVRVNPDRAFS